MKSSIKLLKGSLVEHPEKDNYTFYNHNNRNGRGRYSENDRYQKRYDDRGYQGRNGKREGSRDRRGSSKNNRGRSFSKERRDNSENGREQRERSGRSRERQDRSGSRHRYENHYPTEDVNWCSNSSPDDDEEHEVFMAIVENSNKMILDSAATKTVAGKVWFDNFMKHLNEEMRKKIKVYRDQRYFKFGNETRYPSLKEVVIPIRIGRLVSQLNVSIVDANIPLLLGRHDMQKLAFTVDFKNDIVFLERTKEKFELERTSKNHLALPFIPISIDEEALCLNDISKDEKRKKIEKVHNVLCHPRPDILLNLFKDSSQNDKESLELVKEVSDRCKVCKTHKRTPSRPKVGLPVSSEFNECVSIDLKGPLPNKDSYILYLVDTFSRLTRGVIVKDKKPETIVKAILKCWVLGNGIGPGMPRKFLHDNGREFCNEHLLELAEKYGISLSAVTAANSPFSNGICERNHAVVDNMMMRMKASDDKISDQEALDYALLARNIETTNKGFSPFQVVYGNNPHIPGIVNSKLSSLGEEFKNQDIKMHLHRVHMARINFRQADNDIRLKRALRSQVHPSNSVFHEPGDKVYFKEQDKNEWSGPARVIGMDGRVVFLKYGNNIRRVHSSKVVAEEEDFHDEEVIVKIVRKPSDNEVEATKEDATNAAENIDKEAQSQDFRKENEDIAPKEKNVNERPKLCRKSKISRPERYRKIKYKNPNSILWKEGEVIHASDKFGTSQHICNILLPNDDIEEVDFSKGTTSWKYVNFECDECPKEYPTKRGLLSHKKGTHERESVVSEDEEDETKLVSDENEKSSTKCVVINDEQQVFVTEHDKGEDTSQTNGENKNNIHINETFDEVNCAISESNHKKRRFFRLYGQAQID